MIRRALLRAGHVRRSDSRSLRSRGRKSLFPQSFHAWRCRGNLGGDQSRANWLVDFGFDVILIETVGVGQDQIAARAVVDTLVLLVTPNTGDEVQWEKAGLIEVADLLVVNKSDLPGTIVWLINCSRHCLCRQRRSGFPF